VGFWVLTAVLMNIQTFLDVWCWTLEDGTDRLSQIFFRKLPLLAV